MLQQDTPIQPVTPIDVSRFEEIFTQWHGPICNYLYRRVGNWEQAYDLAQDTFTKVYRALAANTTIHPEVLSSWVYRIASNTATDAMRHRRLISWLPLSLFDDTYGVGAGMPSGEEDEDATNGGLPGYDGGGFESHIAEQETVQQVLARLPEKSLTCLLLYEYEGFSIGEVASILDLTPGAVKMRLKRAREQFITLYQKESKP